MKFLYCTCPLCPSKSTQTQHKDTCLECKSVKEGWLPLTQQGIPFLSLHCFAGAFRRLFFDCCSGPASFRQCQQHASQRTAVTHKWQQPQVLSCYQQDSLNECQQWTAMTAAGIVKRRLSSIAVCQQCSVDKCCWH